MNHLLSEPAIVPDTFCSGLAEVEDLGDGNVRLTYFSKQRSFNDYAGTDEHVIVARLVLPMSAIIAARKLLNATLKLDGGRENVLRLAH